MPARNQLSSVTLEGDLLAPELIDRIASGTNLEGTKPADYGALGRRSVFDEAERVWDDLKIAWADLRESIPAHDDTKTDSTGAAHRSWIEPLFSRLGFGHLTPAPHPIVSNDGQNRFPISHQWTHVLIHTTTWGVGLEAHVAGHQAPHSLVQQCLNASDEHLWGVVTNGRQIRLLRDSTAIAGSAYVEFDLETIFDNELVSDFILLYRLLHVSRFRIGEDEAPSACWLEKWRATGIDEGMRALDQMKTGVKDAITILGTGYLSHPANGELLDSLDANAFHRALLRLTYRLLFLFVAEDKDALHPLNASEKAKERYRTYYSTTRLRAHARRRRGTTHSDLYQGLQLVLKALGNEEGQPKLALPGFGGIFEDTEADDLLPDHLELSNEYLLRAVRALAVVRDHKTRRNRAIDYRHLDAEELGSVYESLLELVPKYSAVERRFQLVELAGNERKTTGSYYTPANLIERLLDTTVDPVIDAAVKRGETKSGAKSGAEPAEAIEKELLNLTVCDPACGSGHFLVASARRIAKRLAAVRERNPEPTPMALKTALRDVIGRCIYGVDLNPMAVELAKVALWMEALEPGKALGFLDSHIRLGNSLVGAYPALMAQGIPNQAWTQLEGDDKKVASELKKRNRKERTHREEGQDSLAGLAELEVGEEHSNTALARQARKILNAPADNVRQVKRKAEAFRQYRDSAEFQQQRMLSDTWCAAFFWPKYSMEDLAPTDDTYWELESNGFDNLLGQAIAKRSTEISEANRFFHWHLEFPEIFAVGPGQTTNELAGWNGGFDAVVGNPPWERLKLQEQEFFATRDVEIAEAPNAAARKHLISKLQVDNPELDADFIAAKRASNGTSGFLKVSGCYPFTGTGDINTYSVFSETARTLTGARGRTGVIVPTGVATDATTQRFFRDLVETKSLVALYDFENATPIFDDVHRSFKFCILSIGGARNDDPARFAFFLHDPIELDDAAKTFNLFPEEILLLNPNTGTCPVFRSRRDAEITLGIYRRVPVLINESEPDGNPWGISFMTMYHMSNDSHLFHTREELEEDGWHLTGNIFTKGEERMLPLYEAKMIDFYNHRAADVVKSETAAKRQNQPSYLESRELKDPNRFAMPLSWVSEEDTPSLDPSKAEKDIPDRGVASRLEAADWGKEWLIGWKDVTSSTNERTVIDGIIPKSGVGHTLPISNINEKYIKAVPGFVANLGSFCLDYTARFKVGGLHLTFFIVNQLPIASPSQIGTHIEFIRSRVIELSFTAHDMQPFVKDLGDTGDPFVWDDERRFVMRAELDALFFHLYGIERDDVDYIMETFPIVKRKDITKFGSYRTKELILDLYDRMAAAGVSADSPLVDGENFTSSLNPPPGDGPRHPATG